MSFTSRLVPRSAVGISLSVVFGILFLIGAWQGLRAWWYHGFSVGTRTGIVRKFSYKGTKLCKYWSGEVALVADGINARPEVWEFTVDAKDENDPLVKSIVAAEATGGRTTLHYRQDKGKWWACAPTEYYVTAVVK